MSQLTPSPRRSPRQSQAESRSGRGSGRKKRESPGSGRKKRSPRPQPEPEPEAVYDSPSRPEPAPEPAYDDSPDPVLESSHLDTSHLLADLDSSHMLADKEHFSMIVEKEDRQDLRLEEIASEAQALLELAGEARKQRKRAQERARRHLEMGRSLVATAVLGDGKHVQAMKEYANTRGYEFVVAKAENVRSREFLRRRGFSIIFQRGAQAAMQATTATISV